jgi:hypothetical protein
MEADPTNNVIQLPLNRVERVNNVALPLGTMTLQELENARKYCYLREREARLEGDIISEYIVMRFSDEPA